MRPANSSTTCTPAATAATPAHDLSRLLDGLELFDLWRIDATNTLLSKIEALTNLLYGCIHQDGSGLTVNISQVTWALIMLEEMVKETQEHVSANYEQSRNAWIELEQRIARQAAAWEVHHV